MLKRAQSQIDRQAFALQDSESKYRSVIENIPDVFYRTDSSGRIIMASPSAADLLRYDTAGELVGRPITSFWKRPAQRAAFEAKLRKHGAVRDFEVELVRSDGSTVVVSTSSAFYYDDTGNITGTEGLFRDITERKLAEAQLIDMKDKAQAANTTKSEFLANMSHEIRTPLNGILGMLQLLESMRLGREEKEYVDAALQSAKRLTGLLSDILDLSRIETGMLDIRDEEFTLRDMEESVRELFVVTAEHKGLELEFAIDPSAPAMVIGDEVRLRQILFNLVGNAVKFTQHGRVRVEISALPVPGDGQSARLLIIVTDSGIGIPETMLKSIFEPFVQVEGSSTRRFQGAGLGLSIVRKLTNLMGGALSIDSVPGCGTTVYLSLPVKLPQPSLPPDAARQRPVRQTSSGLRILLAEDDEMSLYSGQRLLEKSGHVVTAARDGREALDRLSGEDFDLILMDIQLPVMGGLEATQTIRTSPDFRNKANIPIIAMTAYAMAGDSEKFLAAGMDDYVAKPVDNEVLKGVIERVMARPAATP